MILFFYSNNVCSYFLAESTSVIAGDATRTSSMYSDLRSFLHGFGDPPCDQEDGGDADGKETGGTESKETEETKETVQPVRKPISYG